MTAEPGAADFTAVLTITVKAVPGGGLMASLISDGAMSDPYIDRRFYSIPEYPPPELPPYVFWGSLLTSMGQLMGSNDLPPLRLPAGRASMAAVVGRGPGRAGWARWHRRAVPNIGASPIIRADGIFALVELAPAAGAMYNTWWSFVNFAANAKNPDGTWAYSVADAQSAASAVNRDVYGGQGGYNPIGLSQLFSVGRKIGNATDAIGAAPDASPITDSMVAEAPWSRPAADQAALPMWQARVSMTYTDEFGVTQTGISVINISQVLPSTVGSLNAQLALRAQDQLSSPPGTGTPRSGTLTSIDSVTLLAV